MHTYVHWDTVYSSKDLEPTQMFISDRRDKENVAHICHRILCSHKNDEFVSFVGTWMNLETIILANWHKNRKIPYVFTHRWVLKNDNTWTQEEEHHTLGPVGGGEGQWEGEVGRDSLGRNAKCGWRGSRKEKHTAMCVPTQLSYMLCSCTPKPKIQ